MIDIEALKVGDVVQLVSGSPYMTVRGFGPAVSPGRKAARTTVMVVVWSDRVGFVKGDFRPEELRLPPPKRPREAREPAAEGEDGGGAA